jgi:integrase/recombinase XerD
MAKARPLKKAELEMLLNKVGRHHSYGHPPRNYCVLQLLMCGLRVSEVAQITNFQILDINNDARDSFCLTAQQTKTSKERWVYLTESAKKAVNSYCASTKGYVNDNPPMKKCYMPDGTFIESQKGGGKGVGFSANSLAQLVNREIKKAGLNTSSHFGRKQIASVLIEQGAALSTCQKILGHQNISTTSKYVESLNIDLEKSIGKIKF